ncbi:MAG TPA: hypothetical protein VFW33_21250 [Gemmataceae bacterium]|nr:hypothetical protein [Gemmataceae bacterium]
MAEAYQNGKVFAILHKGDPARPILSGLSFAPDDDYVYVFVHGGGDVTRFENLKSGTHEIPADVVASLLANHYGIALSGMAIRMCTCYGNMLRPGDTKTIVQTLAGVLPQVNFEGYHGLVVLNASPPRIRLGYSVRWDATAIPPGAVVTGPPGSWEPVVP